MTIELFTLPTCLACQKLKAALHNRKITFIEHNLETDNTARTFLELHGVKTVPQLLVNGRFVQPSVFLVWLDINQHYQK